MRITDRVRVHGAPERITLEVNGEPRLECLRRIADRYGAVEGAGIEEATLAAIADEDARYRAREKAVELLAYRARSRRELDERLEREGFSDAVRREVIDGLAEKGYVDDEAFARSFVRDRVRLEGRGPRDVVPRLVRKGIDRREAERIYHEEVEGLKTSVGELARQAAEKWVRTRGQRYADDPFRKRLHRLMSTLARRGFGPDSARQAADDVLDTTTGRR